MHPAAFALLGLCAIWSLWIVLWFVEADLARLRGQKPRRPSLKVAVLGTVACIYLILRHHP